MNKFKLRLILIISIQVVLTLLHNLSPNQHNSTNFYLLSNWTYWLGMSWGIFTMIYAFSLGCKACGTRQVFRGLSILSLRWPEDKCHRCGEKIE